jgi:Rieske Fe-S protein
MDDSISRGPVRTRRDFLASVLMAVGLAASYGVLAVQGLLFILPRRLGPKTRRLFVGQAGEFEVGAVKPIQDLRGTEILVKRTPQGFRAFSTVCPHLGCRVHWEADKARFFCPCHAGVFDADGVATAGPPADAGQRLGEVPIEHDETAGTLYLEVAEPERA